MVPIMVGFGVRGMASEMERIEKREELCRDLSKDQDRTAQSDLFEVAQRDHVNNVINGTRHFSRL